MCRGVLLGTRWQGQFGLATLDPTRYGQKTSSTSPVFTRRREERGEGGREIDR